jgi:chaperonin cofactor prefoldin
MSHDLEKKVEAYEVRIKDLEEKYLHTLGQLDRFQALMWMLKIKTMSMNIVSRRL